MASEVGAPTRTSPNEDIELQLGIGQTEEHRTKQHPEVSNETSAITPLALTPTVYLKIASAAFCFFNAGVKRWEYRRSHPVHPPRVLYHHCLDGYTIRRSILWLVACSRFWRICSIRARVWRVHRRRRFFSGFCAASSFLEAALWGICGELRFHSPWTGFPGHSGEYLCRYDQSGASLAGSDSRLLCHRFTSRTAGCCRDCLQFQWAVGHLLRESRSKIATNLGLNKYSTSRPVLAPSTWL